jgi:diguanylate cyclase (GGDEF)-like protein
MNLKDIKLLFVEDDDIARDCLVQILSDSVGGIFAAKDGEEAYEIFLSSNPDVILTDLNLPKMHGLDLIEKIKEKDLHKPIIVFSAYSDRDTLLKVLKRGVDGFIPKPLDFSELLDNLNKAVDKISHLKDVKFKDELTGAYNRKFLKEFNMNGDFYLAFLDLDDFKEINDKYGHQRGDEVLKSFVKCMKKFVSDGDLIIRVGGDEFVLILKEEKEKVEEIMKNILNECRVVDNLEISCSIGVVHSSYGDKKTLIEIADQTMYKVKRASKNSYLFF